MYNVPCIMLLGFYNTSLYLSIFVLQYSLPWAETVKVLHVNSPSPFRERSMMDAPLRAGMMAIAGVPLRRTMTVTNPTASALRLVGGVIYLLCQTMLFT